MRKEDEFAIECIRKSYAAYCYFVHKGKWMDTKFHTYLANKVQTFIETDTGHPYDVLVLSTPPQHGKSMTVTETLPSWYLGNNPDKRCIIGCYNDDFAGKFGRRNKQKLIEYGKDLFGVSLEKTTDRDIEVSQHDGSIIARGIMSGITGNAGDLIILDDPIKNRLEADSSTYRERLWEEWNNSILTRTQAGTKIIIIQTRWHEDDLAGRVIRSVKNVEVVNIPVEAEADDVLGRNVGDALCPEIGKDNAWLKEFKESYKEGMRAWNALYQGRPTSEQGNIFQRSWWQYYDVLPDVIPVKAISVDATFKGGEDSDFVAIEVWGKVNADFYLIDLVKQRLDFPATMRAITSMKEKYPEAHSILIEDKANGPAIIASLRREISGIVAITPVGSKVSRANAVTGIVEAGNVFLPRFSPFTDEFIEEFASFPNGVHDDLVDACTQFLNKYATYNAKYVEDNRSQFERELDRYKAKVLRGNNKRYSW